MFLKRYLLQIILIVLIVGTLEIPWIFSETPSEPTESDETNSTTTSEGGATQESYSTLFYFQESSSTSNSKDTKIGTNDFYPSNPNVYISNKDYYFKTMIYRWYGFQFLNPTDKDYQEDLFQVRFDDSGRPTHVAIHTQIGGSMNLFHLKYDVQGKIIWGRSGIFPLLFNYDESRRLKSIDFLNEYQVVSCYLFQYGTAGFAEKVMVYGAHNFLMFSFHFTYNDEGQMVTKTVIRADNKIRNRWFFDATGNLQKVEYYNALGNLVHVKESHPTNSP